VLPGMQEDLSLNFSQAGALNTANALGYLLGALLTRLLVQSWGNRLLFNRGMLLTAFALCLTGFVQDLYLLSICRLLGGIGGAAIFICGGALASNIAPNDPQWSTRCITIFFGGAGVGLVLCGLLIPWWMASQGSRAWPHTWLAMGVVSWLMLAVTYMASKQIDEPVSAKGSADWALKPLLPAFIAYVGFGLGYIVYMTFIIAWLKAIGASSLQMSIVWSVLGLSTLLAPLIWSKPIASWPNGRAMSAILFVLSLGALLPVIPFEPAWQTLAMQCSAALFGLGMFSAPSSISALIKRTQQKPAWGSAMATFTIAFAASQILAPVASGMMADWSGSLRSGLALSGLIILFSASIAWFQKDQKPG